MLAFKVVFYGIIDIITFVKITAFVLIDTFINSVILIINGFIELLNKIPGVSIETISWSSQLAADATEDFAKDLEKQGESLAEGGDDIQTLLQELDRTRNERVEGRNGIDEVAGLDGALAGYDFDTPLNVDNVANVENVEGEVDVASEDLKLLRELAEQKYIQNYISNAPVVYVTTGDINENADIDYLVSGVAERVREEIDTSMEGVPV